MNKLISLFIFFLYFTSLFSQITIQGRVTSESGNPIPFANILIFNSNQGSSCDQKGFYSLTIANQSQPIAISARSIGFATLTKKQEIGSSKTITLNFVLEKESAFIDEVVISGTMKEMSKKDSPVPIEVYSAKYFENNKNPSIFESLQNVNGVRPQLNCNVCNTGDIHINGLEGPYTMVLIDGMPIVSGLSTVYGLTGIPSSLIDRVEIVKGPASSLYGSEAVGGLINIITVKPSNVPLFTADVYSTSWAETNTDIGARYKLTDQMSGILGVNYFNYQNPIDNNGDNFTDVTLQDRLSIFNKISLQRKNHRELNIGLRYVYEDRWGGEMQWKPEFRGGDSVYGESIYTSRWELFGNYHLPFGSEKINLQLSANGHQQNSVYGADTYIADQKILFGQLSWQKQFHPAHDLLIGTAYRLTYYDDNTGATFKADSSGNDPSLIKLPGVFVQDQITLNEWNTLLLGVRYDYNSIHGNIFSPRINYKWNTKSEKTILRLSGGNGFRVANVFTEDHAALTGAREVIFADELKPERSYNVNFNANQRIYTKNETYVGLDFTAFYTQFTNRIVPDYESNPNQIIYDNLNGEAVSQGVSLNVDLVFQNGLKIMGGVTSMDVSITESGEQRKQLLTESYSGVWNIEYLVKSLGLRLNYTGNLYGPMRLPRLGPLDDRAEFSPWWSLQNIQLTKTINKKWKIYGGVKNLLNYTPPSNSIARSFDPFDQNVQTNAEGEVISTPQNQNALSFDPSYVFAPNQGIRGFLGIKYTLR